MHTVFEIPTHSLDASVLQGFREQYPNAVVRIETDEAIKSGKMDEAHFWAIIGLFDWQKQDDEAIMEAAVAALSAFSTGDIERFYDLLAEKLYALDGHRFAAQLGTPEASGLLRKGRQLFFGGRFFVFPLRMFGVILRQFGT